MTILARGGTHATCGTGSHKANFTVPEDIALYAANMECVTNVDARAGSMVICTQPPAIPVCQCSTVLALVY